MRTLLLQAPGNPRRFRIAKTAASTAGRNPSSGLIGTRGESLLRYCFEEFGEGMGIDRESDPGAGETPEISVTISRDQLCVLVHAAALGAIGVIDSGEKEKLRKLLISLREVIDATT